MRVKCDILEPPLEMTLGAAVTGLGHVQPRQWIILPWTALSAQNGKPAVWIVDPVSKHVSLRTIEIEAYAVEQIVVRQGSEPGVVVVTRGQQLLRPGQAVEALEEPAS